MAGGTMDRRAELTHVGESGWRVCDGTLPEDDGRRVVAFMELVDDHIEVVWIRSTNAPTRFAELDDALNAADAVIAQKETPRSTRPVPIPSFPPIAPRRAPA
ncbi:MAG TPA: hypothetical protein VNT50_06065 [Microbacterium sp.]|uniref:hypothetical protein n=1 Tax=Microbacterium sp. TaxID=51671 RepID=UPI002BCD6571|nr:hypothetical protein [Microbacterium sp.]HWI31034.1 hypothetical protein [Microbacterium sp.]